MSAQYVAGAEVMRQVAVVGAGILGRLLAWKLSAQGYAVTLFDKGSRDGETTAARVAASMLAPYTEVASAERQVFDWGLMALVAGADCRPGGADGARRQLWSRWQCGGGSRAG